MATATVPRLEQQEYIDFDEQAPGRTEYVAGLVYVMPGASPNHSRIELHAGIVFARLALDAGYEPFSSSLRVFAAVPEAFFHPDFVIAAREPDWSRHRPSALTNPLFIVEILSPSTESCDRKGKFEMYTTIPSLREILLIAQTKPLVEQFWRGDSSGPWESRVHEGLEAVFNLTAIGGEVRLADLYARIDWPEE